MNRRLIFALCLLAAPFDARADDPRAAPEAAVPDRARVTVRAPVIASGQMVVAANPHAAKAGQRILAEGGSALDAAIAMQLVLNLVEPQSSGIGGGLFLLHWDAAAKALVTYDGRESAPMAAKPDRFLGPGGRPMSFRDAIPGGLSVGVPGALRALELAHRRHGRLAWAKLFAPAIELANRGFAISPRLHGLLTRAGTKRFSPAARAYFFDAGGRPHAIGHVLRNPAFAQTLRTIAGAGARAFYEGPIAEDIVRAVRDAWRNPGDMTLADLAGYRAKERVPVCIGYRATRVCGMGPPSSGGLTVAMTLGLLEAFDLGEPLNPRAVHLISEAQNLAYADRRRYMADPDFVTVPKGLLDAGYLAERRGLIDPSRALGARKPGRPPSTRSELFGRDGTREASGTSHLSVVDRWGNAVSLTSTIEAAFGSGLMVRGFLLNNELTDFAFRPTDADGRPVANRVEPGKRPRSSMAPTMVFGPNGDLRLITGSPGGSRIILYVVKSLIAMIDWGLNAQTAAALPNFGSRNGPAEVEAGVEAGALAARLADYGHDVRRAHMTSGLHIIRSMADGRLEGGADPRREGIALGEAPEDTGASRKAGSGTRQ